MKKCFQFGPMLREERLKRGIQLWRFAASVPFPAANIQRIEMGTTEPRIGVAMKMLAALEIDAGSFMENLAKAQGWPVYPVPDRFSEDMVAALAEEMQAEPSAVALSEKALFGAYFRRVRLACGLTQAEIATRANHTARSMIAVENGKQEPMVMRTLQLVWVSGLPPAIFFQALALLHKLKAGALCETLICSIK